MKLEIAGSPDLVTELSFGISEWLWFVESPGVEA